MLQQPVETPASFSSWEVIEVIPDESQCLRNAADDQRGGGGGGSLPVDECEIGCDALEVFDVGGESLLSEAEGGGGDTIPATDGGSSETAEAPSGSGKMNWIRKLSQTKLRKFNMLKTSQRHSSAPDGSGILKELTTPAPRLGSSSPKTSPTTEMPDAENQTRVFDDRMSGDLSHHDSILPPPHSAPPIVLKCDGLTFADRVNRKLSNYLRVVRTAMADGAVNDHKGRRDLKLIRVIDLTSDNVSSSASVMTMTYAEYLTLDKTDSFSRSQSSSTSSLENVNKEAVQCLAFSDVYARKSDNFPSPCLWAGTSLGTVLVMSLSFSDDLESRKVDPVVVSPTGTIFRLKGAVIMVSFLDSNGIIIPSPGEQWRDRSREESMKEKKSYCSKTDGQPSSSNLKPRISPVSSGDLSLDQQFAVLCSEKQARVVAMPSQICVFKVKITETSAVTKADIVTLKDNICLACFLLNGHVMTFSLPSLKPLMDVDYIPFPDPRVLKTFCFSFNCHALYFCSPSELQKLTLSAEMSESLSEMLSEMFIPCNMPEAPKQGFFKNLFNVGSASLDREELFGEGSGKAPKGVAKYTSGMSQAQESAGAATSEIGRAKMLALERGEKLGELEERTERLKMDSELYMQGAQQLKNKYKDRKWYQL